MRKASVILLLLLLIQSAFGFDKGLLDTLAYRWDKNSIDALQQILLTVEKKGLPTAQIENKVWEGLAKNRSAEEILAAVAHRQALMISVPAGATVSDAARMLYEIEKKETVFRETPAAVEKAFTPDSRPAASRKLSEKPDNAQSNIRAPEGNKVPRENTGISASPEKDPEKRLPREDLRQEKLENKVEHQQRAIDRKSK
jgi:hypothetical protein